MRYNYCGIARCNLFRTHKIMLNLQVKMSYLQRQSSYAFYYFELVKFFGDVPLVIDERLGVQQVSELSRTPKDQVYAQIESDLQDAVATLSWKSESSHSGIKGG